MRATRKKDRGKQGRTETERQRDEQRQTETERLKLRFEITQAVKVRGTTARHETGEEVMGQLPSKKPHQGTWDLP